MNLVRIYPDSGEFKLLLLLLSLLLSPIGALPEERDPQILFKSASLHLRSGRWYHRSISLLQKAVEQEPNNPYYREALGSAYAGRALELLWLTLPENQLEASNRERKNLQSSNLQEVVRPLFQLAEEESAKALQIQPREAEFYHTLGWILLAQARFGLTHQPKEKARKAQEQFQKAIELAPRKVAYRKSYADLLRLIPELTDASSKGEEAQSSKEEANSTENHRPSGSRPTTTSNQGSFSQEGENPPSQSSSTEDPLLKAYLSALELAPRDAGLHFLVYLRTVEQRGNLPEALDQAEQSLVNARQSDPRNGLYAYLLAEINLYKETREKETKESETPVNRPWTLYQTRALQYVAEGNQAPELRLNPYQSEYPQYLQPILARLFRSGETEILLAVRDNLSNLADQITTLAEAKERQGQPVLSAQLYEALFYMGERLASALYYGGEIAQLSEAAVGLAIEQRALEALARLYSLYGSPLQILMVQQKLQEVNYLTQYIQQYLSKP